MVQLKLAISCVQGIVGYCTHRFVVQLKAVTTPRTSEARCTLAQTTVQMISISANAIVLWQIRTLSQIPQPVSPVMRSANEFMTRGQFLTCFRVANLKLPHVYAIIVPCSCHIHAIFVPVIRLVSQFWRIKNA